MIDLLDIIILALTLGAAAAFWLPRIGSNDPLLPQEPRRPVPWNAVAGCLLAGLLLLGSVTNFFASGPSLAASHAADSGMTAEEFIQAAFANSFASLALVAMLAVTIAITSGATPHDFGLPTSWRVAWRDIRIGVAALAAGFGPVLLVQACMVPLFNSKSQNPTLMILEESPSFLVFASAFVAAVVAAPIFEEFVCRLLLQGWLEKAEHRLIEPIEQEGDEPAHGLREQAEAIGRAPGLAPILISSLVFALLHLSAGPDPIALFLFAVIQGYLYQRTHRILPCVLNHMLFNAIALTLTFASH